MYETQMKNVTSAVEKVITEMGTRFDTTVAEINKLQTLGLEQAKTVLETAARATQEQIAFSQQVGGEWRKMVLAATRGASELFTPKA